MMCETTVDGWDQWRTTLSRWCTKQMLMEETDEGIHTRWCTRQLLSDGWEQRITTHTRSCIKFLIMDETSEGIHSRSYTKQLLMDETDEGIHTRWCTKQLLMDETNERLPVLDDVQHNWRWTRQMKNPYQMIHETSLDVWDQWKITHTRRCTKQLLMDERNEGIHTRWVKKQLLIDSTNDGLPIPDDVQ